MAKATEREEACRLRAEGVSVRRIAAQLGVAKSSVSVWVRDVPVPEPAPPPPPALDPRLKRCGRCRRELSLSLFNRAGDGHQHWCRDCFRTYFRERGDLHRTQSEAARALRRRAAQELLEARLAGAFCTDCGEDEIAVLEFDHVDEKRGNIAQMVWQGTNTKVLGAEMERCEVVCCNCHRRRTARRGGWARLTGVPHPHWTAPHRRNFEHIAQLLTTSGCVDCGERDLAVLEFDHVGPKRHDVAYLVVFASLERLDAELSSCVVRCSNCHRLATLARRGGGWRQAPDWAV